MSPSIELFNEAIYKALMDGLECSEIRFSEIITDNEKYRFDSEFFQKNFLQAYKQIKVVSHTTIKEELEVLTDFHANGSYKSIAAVFELLDIPDYAYMVRTTDLEKRDYFNNVKYVSKRTYDFLRKSKIYGGEVIINKIGCPGKTFLMPHLNKPVSLGMNQFLLRFKKNSSVNNIFVYIFLNTQLGKLLIERKINGTTPMSIDKEGVRTIYIPLPSEDFKNLLSYLVNQSDTLFFKSDAIYLDATNNLTDLLDLSLSQSPSNNVFCKYYLDGFIQSGRLDAEYYQPKFDVLFNSLSNYQCKSLGELVSVKKSIEPGSDCYGEVGVSFVRVSDVSTMGISDPPIKIPQNIVPKIESLYPQKDTILFSKDGTVGVAYKVEKDLNIVTSGALLHLNIKNKSIILPDYLTLVLNSDIVKLQAERDAGGSIIQHWKPKDIANVVIPILPYEKQIVISKSVQESFALRHEAQRLLDVAIRAVEIAIETNESNAIEYIHANTNV